MAIINYDCSKASVSTNVIFLKCKMYIFVQMCLCRFSAGIFVCFVCMKCQSHPGTHICGASVFKHSCTFVTLPEQIILDV